MYKDIEKFYKRYKICMRAVELKESRKNRVIMSDSPNQLWEVDLFGKLHEEDGAKFIFVANDHYSN